MAQLVTAPTRRPRVGGIKDVVAFTPEPRLSVAFGSGGIAWEDAACGLPAATKAGCYDEAVAQADKTGDGPDWYGSILTGPFAQYKGVECWLGGDNEGAKYEEQARAILEAGEDRMIEARLWAWATDGSTIAAAANLQIAVAALEDEADGAYVGQGIILMNRRDAEVAAAAGVIEYKDGENSPSSVPSASTSATSSYIWAGNCPKTWHSVSRKGSTTSAWTARTGSL
jgi:hypothetical protein